jgi:glutamate N-acetyltransferase/amino-acid N-acetyltransferase
VDAEQPEQAPMADRLRVNHFAYGAAAAPIRVCREHCDQEVLRAVVVNSGNANACTGEQGERDAIAMAEAAAAVVQCSAYEVAVASTGVIGFKLPVDRIAAVLPEIALTEDGWDDTSRAIMTTDTRPKVTERELNLTAGTVRIGGVAKGAGMIHPDMATLLAFITTDAEVSRDVLRAALRPAVDATFNAISVDGDTSTNDTVLVLANGASGVSVGAGEADAFALGLHEVCRELALAVVADGEGVTKVFEVHVSGAATDSDARLAARTVTNSNLVRTAIHGADPNWGRILAAAGRSGARVDASRATVRIADIAVFASGSPRPYDDAAVRALFASPHIAISIELGLGSGTAVAWGADLSAEYVRINAEYTT